VQHFGADRLLWGSDYPFVTEQCGYTEAKEALLQLEELSATDVQSIMSGTAESLFGKWQ
jgi:predicted TIM-barrel fold metal-dependent hydrolase